MSEIKETNHSILKNATPTKKIIDFAFIERFIECPLCLEQFDGAQFMPRILPCNLSSSIIN